MELWILGMLGVSTLAVGISFWWFLFVMLVLLCVGCSWLHTLCSIGMGNGYRKYCVSSNRLFWETFYVGAVSSIVIWLIYGIPVLKTVLLGVVVYVAIGLLYAIINYFQEARTIYTFMDQHIKSIEDPKSLTKRQIAEWIAEGMTRLAKQHDFDLYINSATKFPLSPTDQLGTLSYWTICWVGDLIGKVINPFKMVKWLITQVNLFAIKRWMSNSSMELLNRPDDKE